MKKIALIIIALLYVMNTASADIYLGYGDSDFWFEVYSGNSYQVTGIPYTYTVDHFYYFDYPYRVYNHGNYSYFESGWYSYESAWKFAPEVRSYYNYYPAQYYYYDYSWNYYPGWISTYGPAYYGNYYYPPQATLTGQAWNTDKGADCSNLQISVSNPSLTAGSTKSMNVSVYNASKSYFDVSNATVYVDSFDVGATNLKYSKTIKNKSSSSITFDLKAANGAYSDTINATVKVSGTFRDGTRCSTSEAQENFEVRIYGKTQPNTGNTGSIFVPVKSDGSISYKVAKQTQQSGWVEVPTTNQYAENTAYTAPVYANEVQPSYQDNYLPEYSCTGLSFESESFAVNSGETKTQYFTLRNYGKEEFRIDKIESTEYVDKVTIEATRDFTTIYSGQNGAVKVKVLASETSKDTTGTGYITVKGHYASGTNCETSTNNFYIRVNGAEEQGSFELSTPNMQEMSSESGYIEFSFVNQQNSQVTVEVTSNKVLVSPNNFTFNAKTSGNRVLAINGFDEDESIVYFTIRSNGKEITQKYTSLQKPVLFEEADKGIVIESFTERVEGEGVLKASITLLNDSKESKMVSLGIRGLPKEFNAESRDIVLASNETKEIELAFNASKYGVYNAIITVNSGNEEQSLPVTVVVKQVIEENADAQEPANDFISTGFLFVSENGLLLGLLLLVIVGFVFFVSRQ